MRKKEPKAFEKLNIMRGVKAVLVVDTALFLGLYYYWHKMNTSREYRYYMFMNHRWALNAFYKTGEWGGFHTREKDYEHWGIKDAKALSS